MDGQKAKNKTEFVIGVDVGTGNARAGIFGLNGRMFASDAHPIKIFCPVSNHVEQSGIVGYGSLGTPVEKIALAFGMKTLISERKNAPESRDGRAAFETILRDSDVVTLHCPSTDVTRNLIGAKDSD